MIKPHDKSCYYDHRCCKYYVGTIPRECIQDVYNIPDRLSLCVTAKGEKRIIPYWCYEIDETPDPKQFVYVRPYFFIFNHINPLDVEEIDFEKDDEGNVEAFEMNFWEILNPTEAEKEEKAKEASKYIRFYRRLG